MIRTNLNFFFICFIKINYTIRHCLIISLIYFNRTLWEHGGRFFSVQLEYTLLIVLYFSFLEVQNLNLGMNQLWQKKNKQAKKKRLKNQILLSLKTGNRGYGLYPNMKKGLFTTKLKVVNIISQKKF